MQRYLLVAEVTMATQGLLESCVYGYMIFFSIHQVTCERLLNVSAIECGLQQCQNAEHLVSARGIAEDDLIDLFYFLMFFAS